MDFVKKLIKAIMFATCYVFFLVTTIDYLRDYHVSDIFIYGVDILYAFMAAKVFFIIFDIGEN